MTKTDLNEIRELLREGLRENNQVLMLDFGQFVEENINPQFGELGVRIDKLDQRVDGLEVKVANLPTKEYIDDKFADQLSDFQNTLWHHNQSLVDILRDKQIIGLPDIDQLKKFRFIGP